MGEEPIPEDEATASRLRRAASNGRRYLIALAFRFVPKLPFGDRLVNAWTRHAIVTGRYRLLVPPEALRRFFKEAITSQSQRVDDPLTYFEAGVFAGQSMAVWYDTAREEGVGTRCFGADSFQGLPSSVADDEGGWRPGQFACPRPVTEWNLQRLGIPLEDVTLIEGWFDETLTPALAEDVGVVHVAMLDADAFSSTETVLNFVGPLLDDEAWLVFDDWFTGGNVDEATGQSLGTGVERAFEEWMARNPGWLSDIVDDYELERDGRRRKAGRVLRLTRA